MSNIVAHYVSNNWGDALNRPLFNYLAQKECDFRSIYGDEYKEISHILGIGSILAHANKNSLVWGSGFIQAGERIREQPEVCAVRGPLSRKRLIEMGFDCPEVYGDPALLFPLFYNPKIEKKYRWGLIPHYVDYKEPFCQTLPEDCLLIDIKRPIETVVDQLLQCERIASSSLHGLIAADAYKIPSAWFRVTDKVKGGDFKFKDYFLSVSRKQKQPILCLDKTFKVVENDLMHNLSNGKTTFDLRPLVDSCPAIENRTLRKQLKKRVKKHYET